MSVKNLEELFIEQLKDIYYAEKVIYKSLPDMIKAVKDAKLKKAFEKHREETAWQITQIEEVMTSLDLPLKGKKCDAIDGLIKEAEGIMEDVKDPEALDAALILAAQKVEHYEIATYGCLCAFGRRVGFDEQAEKLHKILEQEKKTDLDLTGLAEGPNAINERAAAAA